MSEYEYVTQFSFDIAEDGDTHSDDLREILEMAGYTVVGAVWKATWSAEGYEKGMPPLASD